MLRIEEVASEGILVALDKVRVEDADDSSPEVIVLASDGTLLNAVLERETGREDLAVEAGLDDRSVLVATVEVSP